MAHGLNEYRLEKYYHVMFLPCSYTVPWAPAVGHHQGQTTTLGSPFAWPMTDSLFSYVQPLGFKEVHQG